jgi:hypothetical protein
MERLKRKDLMIEENVKAILNELLDGAELMAAVKERKPQEILEVIEAEVEILGAVIGANENFLLGSFGSLFCNFYIHNFTILLDFHGFPPDVADLVDL